MKSTSGEVAQWRKNMQIAHYQNREKVRCHKINLKAGVIAALVITLEFLILGADSRATEKPIKIAAVKLMAEYQKNEIAADAKYKDKVVAVTGIVVNVGKDKGESYLALEALDINGKIQCFFEKGDDNGLGQLSSGVQVTIIGWCEGKVNEGNILLKKCALKGQSGKKENAGVGDCNLGNTYFGIGDYQEAIKDFDRAIELDPKLAGAYWGRGKTYHELGDYQEAIKDFDRAIELDPKLAGAYWSRGKAYQKLGNQQQANEDFKTAGKLNDQEPQDISRRKEIK
jgi:tetratricopeptide (TPR) repeat protein